MKKIFTLALAMMATMGAMADQLTPAQALARLNNVASAAKGVTNSAMSLAYTATSGSVNTYYAFNKANGGFVLLSADDCMPAVLGEVDGGSFDYASLPDNAKWYIDLLSAEVAAKAKNGTVTATEEHISKTAIPYLMSHKYNSTEAYDIRFDQADPYWTLTPTYVYEAENTKEGRDPGTSVHCYTGCVATAMAQIMTYWQYPTKGTGSNSYTWKLELSKDNYEKTQRTSSSDFSSHTYDWANILPQYVVTKDANNTPVEGITDANRKAIYTLMFDCGVACNMGWGTSTAGGSGSSGISAGAGMIKYFGYSKKMSSVDKSSKTQLAFEELVYNELNNKRPVMCLGGGHAFVCDGFENGKFHFNWGWEGSTDVSGYFYMTETGMAPGASGNGGSGDDNSTYHTNLYVVIGIEPAGANEANVTEGNLLQEASDVETQSKTYKSYNASQSASEDPETVTITCKDGFKNTSSTTLDLGVMFIDLDENGNETDDCWIVDDTDGTGNSVASGATVNKIDVTIIKDLEEGKSYLVVPIYWPTINEETFAKQNPRLDEAELEDAYWDAVMLNCEAVDIPDGKSYPTISITNGATAINNVNIATNKVGKTVKVIRKNRIILQKDGKQFNAAGQQM